ncbi:MAG: hypothetical protein ACXVHV_09270, partial [Methanobacterium sp.]
MKSYLELEGIYREISSLSDTLSILSWDDAVMMPVKSADSRSEQISTIKSIIHKKITSNNIRDLIIEVEDKFSELSDIQKRNLQLMKKKWIHANAINNELVVKYSKLSSQTENIWRTARANNDFKSLLSPLKELILVTKEISLMKAEHLNCSPYEALIDEYDPNRKISDIENIFGKLKLFLPDFINKIIEKQKSYNIENIRGNFPVDKQRAIGTFLMEKLGFDFNMGRFDVSLHPFCGGHSRDVRITTRYREDNFIPAMMGVIHETGHALYEFGLPIEKFPGQPISEALGMAFHESQSLFIEMQIGRSRPFVNKLSKILPEYYGMQKAF